MVAFGVAFIAAYLLFTEFNTSFASETPIVLFKRGSKARVIKEAAVTVDEEKTSPAAGNDVSESSPEEVKASTDKALASTPAMTDVFSWQHMQYVVPLGSGERRRLLDDVSGYVAPGKLTALMGESGAGMLFISIFVWNRHFNIVTFR